MLWKRVLTALPLAILLVWAILFQPGEVFYALTLLMALPAAWEWSRLAGLQRLYARGFYVVLVFAAIWLPLSRFPSMGPWLVYAVVLLWLYIVLYLFTVKPETRASVFSLPKLLAGVLIIPAAVIAMNRIHAAEDGAEWLLYGLVLVWIADIGAYFSGRRFGRRKLAPRISPGKTIEGLVGAVLAVQLYSLVAVVYFGLAAGPAAVLCLLAIVLTLVSVAGDLYVSVLKRERGVKDSGVILPGHGGMLDRIDSVLAAMPVFALGVTGLLRGDWAL